MNYGDKFELQFTLTRKGLRYGSQQGKTTYFQNLNTIELKYIIDYKWHKQEIFIGSNINFSEPCYSKHSLFKIKRLQAI